MGNCTSGASGGTGGSNGNKSVIEQAFSKEEQSLINGIPKNQQKDFYYSIKPSEKTVEMINNKVVSPDYLSDGLKNTYISINESLPQLEGSPKQISWAEDIRKKQITDQVERITKRMKSASKEQREQAYKQLDVSSLNAFVNKFITEIDANGAMMKLKKQRSAKAIIDSR